MFVTLQNLTIAKRDEQAITDDMEKAAKHLAFSVLMCMKQAAAGRRFVLEHPASASSW